MRAHPDAPEWSGDPPDPREAGPGHAYRCLECAWSGRSAQAYDHHRDQPAHRIVLRDAPQFGPVIFGCCLRVTRED
jgi:hypothetical protein